MLISDTVNFKDVFLSKAACFLHRILRVLHRKTLHGGAVQCISPGEKRARIVRYVAEHVHSPRLSRNTVPLRLVMSALVSLWDGSRSGKGKRAFHIPTRATSRAWQTFVSRQFSREARIDTCFASFLTQKMYQKCIYGESWGLLVG